MMCAWHFLFLMLRRPPRSTRTDTRFPDTALFRSSIRGSVVRFLGIPYAAPPKRFELPQRPISWDGVRDMDDPGPAAPHRIKPFPAIDPSSLAGHGSDGNDGDTLRLNIWAPSEAGATTVMLLIQGGGFVAGRKDGTGKDRKSV